MTIGRPRNFEGTTTKVSVIVPTETARALRVMAAEQGLSVAQLVDEWTRKALIQDAVEKGRKAIAEGDVISHEDMGQRLKRWAGQ